eukprot:m.153290 g.153290  ORF g.153290 m.153290 type:complete len:150 (+) comp16937_c3_seq1:197-646(+)
MVDRDAVRELPVADGIVLSLAFSPDGTQLASSTDRGSLQLWDVSSGRPTRALVGHTDLLWSIAFFPGGRQLASCSDDKTLRIWTLVPWSDRTHRLFPADFKSAVFHLMCVRSRLSLNASEPLATTLPQLPMELWLQIFDSLQRRWSSVL